MSSIISEFVFSEPSGRPYAIVMFSASLVFLSGYVHFGILGDSSSISGLFLSVGCAMSGIAEGLPKDRVRTAGLFRVTGILVLISLIVTTIIAPESIIGSR